MGYLRDMSGLIRGAAGIIEQCDFYAKKLGLQITLESKVASAPPCEEYLSVAAARTLSGQIVTYGAVHHRTHRGRLLTSSTIDDLVSESLQVSAISVLKESVVIGASAIRFTSTGELIDISEGLTRESLWTLYYSYISQFENAVRAAHDLPLGAPEKTSTNFAVMEYSAPQELDMQSPYLHLFAHDPMYIIRQFTSHTGIVGVCGEGDLFTKIIHAVDYLEGVINE